MLKTKVVIFRNTFGTIVGISVNGTRLPYVESVTMSAGPGGVPRVAVTMVAQDIEFVSTNSASASPDDIL